MKSIIFLNNICLLLSLEMKHLVPHAPFLLMGVAIAGAKFFMCTESCI